MFNTSTATATAEEFEIKEQELRHLSFQRTQNLESQIISKDRKLQEQDHIIKAQMSKISQQSEVLQTKESLLSEYETRFEQVKQVLDDQVCKHQSEQAASVQDVQEWQDRCHSLETKLTQMSFERSDLLGKIKDQQWLLDQEQKRGLKEVAGQLERTSLDKQQNIKELDSIKREIQERHVQEIQQKNADMIRTENLLSDRCSKLEKELSRVELISIQQKQQEDDLRQKCDLLSTKNERFRLDLFQAGDQERKQSLKLQLQVNELRQDVEVREQFSQKQQQDWQLKLQALTADKERLQCDLEKAQERLKHQSSLSLERTELELQKVRAFNERQMESLISQVDELQSERETLKGKILKLTCQVKDMERDGRRELQQLLAKLAEAEQNYEHFGREQRATVHLKNKEILSQREEIEEFQSRIGSKTQELRHQIVSNSMISAKYEDALHELDRLHQTQTSQMPTDLKELTLLKQENFNLHQIQDELQEALSSAQRAPTQANYSSIDKTAVTQQQTPREIENLNLLNVDDDLLQQPNQPHSTKNNQPFSPINSDIIDNQIVHELEQDNRNLRLQLQSDYNQVQDLQKQLFHQTSLQKQFDQQKLQFVQQLSQKQDKIQKLQSDVRFSQDELQDYKTKYSNLETYILQLKIERDRLIDISQNLKIQLLNSEKLSERSVLESPKQPRSSLVTFNPDLADIETSRDHKQAFSITTPQANSSFAIRQSDIRQSIDNDIQDRLIDQISHYQPGQQQRSSDVQGSLAEAFQDRLIDQTSLYQPQKAQSSDKMSDFLANFQPNMKMFDQSVVLSNSVITGQHSIDNLRSKIYSPTSILKHSTELRQSLDSEIKKNLTFGEAKVTFMDDSTDNVKDIQVTQESAKAAAQARLQQLKKNYGITDQMFPLKSPE